MYYKILIRTAKYSISCKGFRYVLLYVISLTFYIVMNFSSIVLGISLILSIMMLYASILADKTSLLQLLMAYSIVGLKKREKAGSFNVFANIRVLIISITYFMTDLYLAMLFIVLSNIFMLLVYRFTFQRV